MFSRPILALAFLPGLLHAAPGDFIRQIQTVGGQTVIHDIPVHNDKGDVISRPLAGEMAVFQLYALDTAADGTQEFKKLDETTVGTFLPSATARILSEDPYPTPRTRADRPYGIRITVSDMEPGNPAVPGFARRLRVVRSYSLCDTSTYLPDGRTGEYDDPITLAANGTYVAHDIVHLLPEPEDRPTKACGEESFTVFLSQPGDSPRSEQAKATIQIWPVADCEIRNLEEGKTYLGVPQNVTIVLRDLYPDSETRTQIYQGEKAPGTVGTVLPSSVIKYESHLPQNANLPLGDLESALGDDGWYTLEVLTKTPFNDGAPEIIASVSFILKRSIKVNGMLGTME